MSRDDRQQAQSPGEGGAYPYQTGAGERWRVKGLVRQPDGTAKEVNKRGFATKKEALAWLADAQSSGRKGEYIEPSKQQLGAYAARGDRRAAAQAADQGVVREEPAQPCRAVPDRAAAAGAANRAKLTAHYRQLEKSGRKDHRAGEGLSARTVRYVHTIIHGVLGQAVRDGLLMRNPADAATPPTAREAKAPEMYPLDLSRS